MVAHQAPLSMGFSRQDYWSGLLCHPPGDPPKPGIEPGCPWADSLLFELPEKQTVKYMYTLKLMAPITLRTSLLKDKCLLLQSTGKRDNSLPLGGQEVLPAVSQ